jgi:hypothetical protein
MSSFENGSDTETVSMSLNFSEIPLIYRVMTVPWYIVLKKDGWFSMASLWSQRILVGIHYALDHVLRS